MDRINNYAQGVSEIATLESIRNNLGVEASEYTPDESQPERDRVFTFAQQEKVLSILADIDTGVANLVAKADTNAENIATNTANIAQNQGSISANNKRISNIEKLLQGNLYDYQTDNTSAYTKTVPSGAMPYASLDSIGGKTLVWNQIFPFDFSTTTGMNIYQCTATVNDNVLTMTVDGTQTLAYVGTPTAYTPKFEKSHTFYVSADIYNAVEGANVGFGLYGVDTNVDAVNFPVMASTGFVHQQRICKGATAGQEARMRVTANSISVAGTVQVKNAFICDLTLMFGAGNEPSTVEEFTAQFPAQYYPYNAGTLLSAGVTEVVSQGKNLADFSGGRGYPSDGTTSPTTKRTFTVGTWVSGIDTYNNYNVNGISATVSGNAFVVTKNLGTNYGVGIPFECEPNKEYTVSTSVSVSGSNTNLCLSWYAEDGTYISGAKSGNNATSFSQTSPANAKQGLFIMMVATSGVAGTFTNIQIEHGSTATSYSPYFAPAITPIPAEIQALEGYGWSAGSVFNYIDFERKVFVKCVESIDMGSIPWGGYDSSFGTFWTVYTGWATPMKIVGSQPPNIICDKYPTIISSDLPDNDKVVIAVNTRYLSVKDSSFGGNLNDFRTAMSGVTLYYELATPVEVDISEYLTDDDNLIEVGSGSTLTFPNSNGDDYRIDVPSSETYMVDLQSALGE